MSFQHFRLGDLALHQPLQHNLHPVHHHQPPPQQHQQHSPPHHQHISSQPIPGQSQFQVQIENPITTFSVSLKKNTQHSSPQQQPPPKPQQQSKQPYGSGDADDGYTLAFANLQEFNEWRQVEEDRTMCEFVKGDTHGSKAVPPRFKDHTKLVCARHSRSGRKKYIKKHPERVRKVPSRKLEVGCPASISYKTYFDTEQVRACYVSQHSHEIGLANLPFTRRGRREAATLKTEKDKTKPTSTQAPDNSVGPGVTSVPSGSAANNAANEQSGVSSADVSPQPAASAPSAASSSFSTAVSMLAPLPPQGAYPVSPPQTYAYATPAPPPQVPYSPVPPAPQPQPIHAPTSTNLTNDRWENMATLFQSIRDHARNFDYPSPSVAALETILIRLYLESPVGMGIQSASMTSMMPTIMAHARGVANAPTTVQAGSAAGGPASDVAGRSTTVEGGS